MCDASCELIESRRQFFTGRFSFLGGKVQNMQAKKNRPKAVR
jgi:hypothetical protein